MAAPPYVSQQATILQSMIAYAINTINWPDGNPELTNFNPGSVIYSIFSANSIAADAIGFDNYVTRLAAYLTTAVGADLDNKVADYGLVRKVSVPASGTFTFTRNNPATSTITVPAGSLISTIPTASTSIVKFATNIDATMAIGHTSIQVDATCQVSGSAGNISAGAQLVIGSQVPGIDGVTLVVSITNGDEEESDDALRARGLVAFQALAHGTIASYMAIVMSVAGIEGAIVVPQNRGPGTVDIFIEGPNNSIPSPTLQAEAQAAINAEKVATDDVTVLLPVTVTIAASLSVKIAPGYDHATTFTAVQGAVSAYIEGLGIGAKPTYGFIYAAQLVAIALTVLGVYDAATSFTDTQVTPQQMPVAGIISVGLI